MNKAQWKAIRDYAEDMGYCDTRDVLTALKANGTLDRYATYDDLAELANGDTYEDMMQVLCDNLA